jgi:hypothetical protein
LGTSHARHLVASAVRRRALDAWHVSRDRRVGADSGVSPQIVELDLRIPKPMEVPLLISLILLLIAGLAIFWFRYVGKRARWPGLAAFGLGLLAVVGAPVTHAFFGVESWKAQRMFFVIHLVTCVTLLLLLRTVMVLRDPASGRYQKVEALTAIVLGAVAVLFFVASAWYAPQKQDTVVQAAVKLLPFIIAIAIAARYGWSQEGMLGAGSFLAIGLSLLAYSDDSLSRVLLSAGLQFAGLIGMLFFFYVASAGAEQRRSRVG